MKMTIDRIDGNIAVLMSREDESLRITVPILLLPLGSREGDIISMTLDADPAETKSARDRITGIVNRMRTTAQTRE